jgi:hypothetical protein
VSFINPFGPTQILILSLYRNFHLVALSIQPSRVYQRSVGAVRVCGFALEKGTLGAIVGEFEANTTGQKESTMALAKAQALISENALVVFR